MTPDAFLYTFILVILVRGTSSTIISDNATPFKLGSETLKSVLDHVLKSDAVQFLFHHE